MVLLINTYYPYPYSRNEYTYNRIWPPICLLNCAAILERSGYSVAVLDAHARRIEPPKIAKFIEGYNKILISSSPLDKWQCPNIDISTFLETVKHIRRFTDEVYVMGYHGTVEPEKILNLTGAKAIIRGEPEYTVVEICEKKDLVGIQGVSFKSNGRFISSPDRAPFDLKALPVPAYHLLDINKYFYEILGRNFALFEISRGCNYRCRFCNKIMYPDGLRAKSTEQIIEEVKTAIKKYDVRTGYFIDLEFLSNREIVSQLCEFLIKKRYNFKWCCQTRPDSLDKEILRKMKEAGCRLIHLGVESGLQKFLNYLGKNITIEKIEKSVKMCKQVGIRTLAFFLFGLPDETDEDREKSFNFVKKLNTDFVSLHKVVPYEGCDIYPGRRNLSNGVYQDDFESVRDVYKFIRKAFIKFYSRPSYLYKLNPSAILSGFRLFKGRIKTLK